MTPSTFLLFIVFICGFFLAWTYVLYGFFLRALKRFYKPIRKGQFLPTISVIIPAYNEESVIEKKLKNTLSLTYPKDKMEIIVVDDGSTDRTSEIAGKFKDVKVISIKRSGKNVAINHALSKASGEIIVHTDADCFSVRKDALMRVVENFADPSIGAVSSGIQFQESKSAFINKFFNTSPPFSNPTWVYEGLLDSMSSGLGVFLAFRRSLVKEIDEKCFADDVAISIHVRKQGLRVVFEPELEIVTQSPHELRAWYRQYLRRTLSGLVTLLNHKSLLFNPKYGWYGTLILPTKSLFPHLVPFFIIGGVAAIYAMNPVIGTVLTLATLLLALFSFNVKKMVVVQFVGLHAWIYYLLGRYGPTYWMKEPRS